MSKDQRVIESFASGGGVIDADSPVIRGCKILGFVSKHGRRYSREAIRKAVASRVYEGAAVFIDHPEPDKISAPRAFVAKFGVFRNVRESAEGEAVADLHYNPKHILADTFKGWVQFDPGEVGFSHDAAISQSAPDASGVREVTEITKVFSVDLVATPATTHGIFESADSMEPDLMADAGKPADAAASGLDAAVSALLAAILADATLDSAAKKKKVLVALKLMDDAEGPGDGSGEEKEVKEGDDGEEEVTESEDEEEDKKEKKVEESIGKLLSKLETYVTEAIGKIDARVAKIKSPVARAAQVDKAAPLTVDMLMTAIAGGSK